MQTQTNPTLTSQQVQPEFKFEGGHLTMGHQDQTGLPQVKDVTVNDRDRMQDLLAQEKYLTAGYNVSAIEASHDELHQVLMQNLNDCHQLQRQVFNLMFKKGWYKLPVADAQSAAHAQSQFEQYRAQFPFPAGTTPAQFAQATGGQPLQVTGSQPPQATGTATQADQQLQQRVNQALQQVGQGRVPQARPNEALYVESAPTAARPVPRPTRRGH
jgi:spore coat protein CotF